MDDASDRHTPTIPTDFRLVLSLRGDPVVALRIHGTGAEVELPLTSRVTIGSSASCEVVVDDTYVSSEHCHIERRGDRVLVRDRHSKNGTFVNGNRIEVAELPVGAVLTVGRTGLTALGRRSRHRPGACDLLVGQHPAFRAAVERALRAATTSCNVLIVGETGTGKELVARAIHEGSPRALGPFVAVNCGAIAAELCESELFGHEKGAFTGASIERDGVFVQADGGTLFLDELGELPRLQQPAFLRALETRTVKRVGGHRERKVDIRLVAATNQLDLGGDASPLRSDLYHRVATVVVELPPLRQRADDIPLLVATFLAELEPEFGPRVIDQEALRVLSAYAWPGNVRELRHAVHRAVALSLKQLRIEDLLPYRPIPTALLDKFQRELEFSSRGNEHARSASAVSTIPFPTPPADADGRILPPIDAALKQVLVDAYRRHGSVRRAARALGIPKSTFADRARRLGVI